MSVGLRGWSCKGAGIERLALTARWQGRYGLVLCVRRHIGGWRRGRKSLVCVLWLVISHVRRRGEARPPGYHLLWWNKAILHWWLELRLRRNRWRWAKGLRLAVWLIRGGRHAPMTRKRWRRWDRVIETRRLGPRGIVRSGLGTSLLVIQQGRPTCGLCVQACLASLGAKRPGRRPRESRTGRSIVRCG